MLTRRNVLTYAAATTALAACGQTPGPSTTSAERQIDRIGLQTYTLRDALAEDFVGTFQMIKEVGYDYVELNRRNFAERTPAELKSILDDVGLPAPATHVDYDSVANAPEQLAETCRTLGCDYAIIPWLDAEQRGLDDYYRHADMFNRSGDVLKSLGVTLAYHNHSFEFFELGDDQKGMDILLQETDASLVDFELDLFWAMVGGANIAQYFRDYPGRFKLCHIKDLDGNVEPWRQSDDYGGMTEALMVNVGEGVLPFEDYFALNDVSGMAYFIAEHDNPPKPYRQSIKTSHDTLRAMRF